MTLKDMKALAATYGLQVQPTKKGELFINGSNKAIYYDPEVKLLRVVGEGAFCPVEPGEAVMRATMGLPPLERRAKRGRGGTGLKKIRLALLAKDPHCFWCGTTLTVESSTLDHLVPKARGGSNGRQNLVLACGPCNQDKAHESWEVPYARV